MYKILKGKSIKRKYFGVFVDFYFFIGNIGWFLGFLLIFASFVDFSGVLGYSEGVQEF